MSFNCNIKCFICGANYEGAMFEDECPVCDWLYTGNEIDSNPDEIDEINKISIRQAKDNYKKGLTVFGEPLPRTK